MVSPEGGAPLRISLVYSPAPRQVREWSLELAAGATVAQALAASGVFDEFAELRAARPVLGHGNYRSPIKGLYMCGAGTHPGGGVTGAPGHNAAREVLKDRVWKGRAA